MDEKWLVCMRIRVGGLARERLAGDIGELEALGVVERKFHD